jgi:hypothetical protein
LAITTCLGSLYREMPGAEVDHLTRTNEQDALIGDTLEDPLGQTHGGGGHGNDIGTDRRR